MTRTPGFCFGTAAVAALVSVWLLWTLILEEDFIASDSDGLQDSVIAVTVPAVLALALVVAGLRLTRRR
ncbi:hypothetical protein [Actinoplanes sp. NPDC051494]|uniref:hypothetical protein n=1 Tax=Actinoplanes sp. NPDC051494 TaxID=3363907 RepID=UPI00378D64C4